MLDLIGKRLGQYEILEEIGRGGMAVVYKAYQPSLQRYVAIKVLLLHLSEDKDLVERFEREALAASRLEHPNIIRIYDIGQEGDVHYLVMSYVAGPSVAQNLKEGGALDLHTALSIVREVAAALDFAHRQGVVHRDVKPSNILLTLEGHAILSDFGIARAAFESRLTQTGAHIGTPAYMSPEQAEGLTVDGRADLYSLGVVLYEILTGHAPFQADTPAAVLYKQVHTPPPSLSTLSPTVPKAVECVVLRALAKEPDKRYATAGEMVAALQKATPDSSPAEHPTIVGPLATRPLVGLGPRRVPMPALLAIGALVIAIVGVLLRSSELSRRGPTAAKTLAPSETVITADTAVSVAMAGKTAIPIRTTTSAPPTMTSANRPITLTMVPTATPAPTGRSTATPRPTPKLTPTPTPIPVPMLVSPENEATVGSEFTQLVWTGSLKTNGNEWFDVRLWQEGQAHLGIAWTQALHYECRPPKSGKWYWAIAIIRQTSLNPDGTMKGEQVGLESDLRWFEYTYSPPPPEPTNLPPTVVPTNPPPTPEPTNPPPTPVPTNPPPYPYPAPQNDRVAGSVCPLMNGQAEQGPMLRSWKTWLRTACPHALASRQPVAVSTGRAALT
jgi:serine/threonine protein kinase